MDNAGSGVSLFVFVGIAIAAIAALVVWFLKRSYKKYAEAWATLAPIVGGASKGSKMTGTYENLPVAARINAVSDGDNNTSYFFEIKLTTSPAGNEPRGKDWKILYGGEKLLGFGEKRWHVSTKDETLKRQLEGSGVIQEVERSGNFPSVTYRAKRGELEYSERVGGMFAIPTPERFAAQLDMLARLAQTNERANAA